jgi:prephenate dehydrogenase
MAGKEQSGAAHAEAGMFAGSAWLFTGADDAESTTLPEHPYKAEWLEWVGRFGARVETLTPARHDALCAAMSHLPQMLATALSAMLQERFGQQIAGDDGALQRIGGRALREMTRLGASPYSMWRDVAMTNENEVASVLLAMEQELAHLRENLKGPELRRLFEEANAFREGLTAGANQSRYPA